MKLLSRQLNSVIMVLGVLCLWQCASPRLYRKAESNKPYDAIIVPGIPYDGKDWDFKMKGRVIWANYLVNQGIAKHVIFSGGAVYTPYAEARVMALYAEALGMPKDRILIEDRAEHSTENLYYSYILAKKAGFSKIALATDPYQSAMLKGFIKRLGLPVARIPFRIRILMKIDGVRPVIDASSARVEHFQSIKETQSRRYRRNGTRGRNIVFETP